MNKEKIELFERIFGQLKGFHAEVTILAKKKPNEPLNEFKIKLINQMLLQAKEFLGKKNLPLDGFEKFDLDSLPTNSDVTMVLDQYIVCLDNFKSDNVILYLGQWYWKIKGEKSSEKTSPPRRLGK